MIKKILTLSIALVGLISCEGSGGGGSSQPGETNIIVDSKEK